MMDSRPHQPWRTCFRNCLIGLTVAVALLGLLLFMLAPIGPGWKREYSCPGQLGALATALQMYALDNDGVLPSVRSWQNSIRSTWFLKGELPNLLECAEADGAGEVRHVMLPMRGEMQIDGATDPWRAVLLYDDANGRSVFRRRTFYTHRLDQLRNALSRPGLGIAYMDGHAAWRTRVTTRTIASGRDDTLSD